MGVRIIIVSNRVAVPESPRAPVAGGLAVADYFATFDTVQASNADRDLGSGGTLVLPDLIDAAGRSRHLAVGAGKDGHIYVVDRDSMGKWNASSNQNYQDISGALGGLLFGFDTAVIAGAIEALTRLVRRFSASVTLGCGGLAADARSTLELSSLSACLGMEVHIHCEGPDAEVAGEAVASYLSSGRSGHE